MTKYKYYIDKFQAEWIFSPIRNRKDVIILLMKSIKLISIYEEPPEKDRVGELTIAISKMSRIFYSSYNKVFSINFPFFIRNFEDKIDFYTREFPEIDNRITSIIIELIESNKLLDSFEVFDFAEVITDATEIDRNIWILLRELIIHEDGYLRFDHDPVNVKVGAHPLNHYDIFYSTATTFKLEANLHPNLDYLIDVLDTKSNCYSLR